jgi:hypothetical protein
MIRMGGGEERRLTGRFMENVRRWHLKREEKEKGGDQKDRTAGRKEEANSIKKM